MKLDFLLNLIPKLHIIDQVTLLNLIGIIVPIRRDAFFSLSKGINLSQFVWPKWILDILLKLLAFTLPTVSLFYLLSHAGCVLFSHLVNFIYHTLIFGM